MEPHTQARITQTWAVISNKTGHEVGRVIRWKHQGKLGRKILVEGSDGEGLQRLCQAPRDRPEH